MFGVTAKLTLLKESKTEDFSLAKDRERVLKSPYPENVFASRSSLDQLKLIQETNYESKPG